MKVYIITEGNVNIGFGHIARCISLYQAFEEKGIIPHFIINGDKSIKPLLHKKSKIFYDWLENYDILLRILKGSEITVIDSYLANYSIYKKISESVKIPVFIDDTLRLDYPPGIVINSSIFAKSLNYKNSPDKKYLLGSEYCMLRKEFWSENIKEINKEINSLMITVGGNDIRNITPKILEILIDKIPKIKKKIIIGKGFQNITKIESLLDKNCELIYFPNAKEMKNIMFESDIAITAGGQTVYELACIGVPAITIAVSDEQIYNVKSCAELGLNYYAGWWQDKNILDNIIKFIQKLQNVEIRKEMIKKGHYYIKSDGSRKIIDFLLNLLINKEN